MPARRPRTALSAVSDAYPWADLVIDYALDRRPSLPSRLPPVMKTRKSTRVVTDSATGAQVSAHLSVRPDKGADLIYLHTDSAGRRTGFVVQQKATDGITTAALAVIFPYRAVPWQTAYEEPVEAIAYLGALADYYRHEHATGVTADWGPREARKWAPYVGAGITSRADQAMVSRSGIEPTWWDLQSVASLVKQGVSVADICYWWRSAPNQSKLIAALVEHRLTRADVTAYAGSALDPFRHHEREQHVAVERVAEIARNRDEGWTKQGRRAVAAMTPAGCSESVWADLWVQFMSPARAGLYAVAGITYAEAVRFETTGTGPDEGALAMLAGLNT